MYDSLLRRTNVGVFSGATFLTTNGYAFDAAGRLSLATGAGLSAAYSYVANSLLVACSSLVELMHQSRICMLLSQYQIHSVYHIQERVGVGCNSLIEKNNGITHGFKIARLNLLAKIMRVSKVPRYIPAVELEAIKAPYA